jgi:hypothetical protein
MDQKYFEEDPSVGTSAGYKSIMMEVQVHMQDVLLYGMAF